MEPDVAVEVEPLERPPLLVELTEKNVPPPVLVLKELLLGGGLTGPVVQANAKAARAAT